MTSRSLTRGQFRAWTRVGVAAFGVVLWTAAQAQPDVGYSVLFPGPGNRSPVASALFSYTNSSGVLVSEAGVGATRAIRSGRVFVDEVGTQTGIALANPSSTAAVVVLILRDSSGTEIARSELVLPARRQSARYVSETFPDRPRNFTGSLTFESNQPLGAIALRESRNAQGEPLYATLPVADSPEAPGGGPIVFPHIAAGDGYTTQIVLINSGSQVLRGRVRLIASDGLPLLVRLEGVSVADFAYEIVPQGIYRAELEGVTGLGVGYAVVVPDTGSRAPSGTAIFQFRAGGLPATEAGVAAIPATTTARIFVDYTGTTTGVAVANPGDSPADLTLTLMDRYGVPEATTTRRLPARNHMARFVHELFPVVSDGYTGLMELRSSNPIVPITLKLTANARNNLVLTTLPVTDLTQPPSAEPLVFPHIALGAGFATRIVLLNADTAQPTAGRLAFYRTDGNPMVLPLGGVAESEFLYQMPPGSGGRLYPGNSTAIASVLLLGPSNQPTNELVINEGNTAQLRLQILDATAARRDDVDATVVSLDRDIANANSTGGVQGKKAGFSTLTITAGGVVITATATVVKVDAGASGFDASGLVQDTAQRLYLASHSDHSVLLAQDLKQKPQVYAGVPRSAGLKNDRRLQSLFNNPSFLALNQAEGSLYVSDEANQAIRRIRPGPDGRVETLAGSGSAGSRDGPLADAAFSDPQGLALDARGNLWVADSGNHTIRRINLAGGTVETIAGRPGAAGSADGRGGEARFRSPAGLAVESETTGQQLERARRGGPLPPVAVIVADAGNGLIRRVKETGEVETLRTEPVLPASLRTAGTVLPGPVKLAAPVRFQTPTGVALDPAGNIYVTDPGGGTVRAILRNGEVVDVAQANTFVRSRGVAISETGRVIVTDSSRSVQEIRYGEPQIISVSPQRITNRGGQTVTLRGVNFSSESTVFVAGVSVSDLKVHDTQRITFTVATDSGIQTVTVQNRGGLAQARLAIEATPLNRLGDGEITTIAGGSTYAGDGAAAVDAAVSPYSLALDTSGNVYIADPIRQRIRRVDGRTGIITTVAGSAKFGFGGDGGPALSAQFTNPVGLSVDEAGNVFVADQDNHRIRRIDAATGIITTVAGNGRSSRGPDSGPATELPVGSPRAVHVDPFGNLLISDIWDRIRKVDTRTGIMTILAGTGETGFSGDGGPARNATFNRLGGIATDRSGNVFVADRNNHRIRRVDAQTGIVSTAAGSGDENFSGDGGPAVNAGIRPMGGLAIDADGNLFIADANHRVRKVASTGVITTVAGDGQRGVSSDGGLATASVTFPDALAIDGAGTLFIAENRVTVRRISPASNVITTVAGRRTPISDDNLAANDATLRLPRNVVVDRGNNIFFSDWGANRVGRIDAATGAITTVAGNGLYGLSGDGGPAVSASLRAPAGLAVNAAGDLFIADSENYRIRKVAAATGVITTVAGCIQPIICLQTMNLIGDGGPALNADLGLPTDVAVDSEGNLFITDLVWGRVRRVDARTGIINSIAGKGFLGGFSGDGGPAAAAEIQPFGIELDQHGNLYIAEYINNRIRKVDAATGIITTVAGSGEVNEAIGFFSHGDFAGDGGPATSARLNYPWGVTVDSAGNLFIADSENNRIRRVDAITGIITTVAGSGPITYQAGDMAGDNGAAVAARLRHPTDLALDASGNLIIADAYNFRVRAVRRITSR